MRFPVTEIEKFLALPAEEQEEKIKRLLHETIHDGPPEVKETAYEMGLSPYTLYKWGSTESEKVPRPRQLIHLLHLKNNLRFLDFIEGLFGRTAFAVPKSSVDYADINRAVTKVISCSASYLEEVADLVDAMVNCELRFDHQWDAELKDVEVACRQLQAKAEALLHMVRLVRDGARMVKLGTKRQNAK